MKSPVIHSFNKAATAVLVVIIPFILILLAVRILMAASPLFVSWEYNRSSFPEDPYGFSVEERIYWSNVDIQYLLDRDPDISYFDSFQLESGDPMHNERELSHMEDVRVLSDGFWLAGKILLLVFILLVAVLWSSDGPVVVGEVLQKGAASVILLMLTVLLVVSVGFDAFFVFFHRIFFEGDTWLFKYSDTFIRLYPEMFWQDIFILLAFISAALAGIFALAGRRFRQSLESQDDVRSD